MPLRKRCNVLQLALLSRIHHSIMSHTPLKLTRPPRPTSIATSVEKNMSLLGLKAQHTGKDKLRTVVGRASLSIRDDIDLHLQIMSEKKKEWAIMPLKKKLKILLVSGCMTLRSRFEDRCKHVFTVEGSVCVCLVTHGNISLKRGALVSARSTFREVCVAFKNKSQHRCHVCIMHSAGCKVYTCVMHVKYTFLD